MQAAPPGEALPKLGVQPPGARQLLIVHLTVGVPRQRLLGDGTLHPEERGHARALVRLGWTQQLPRHGWIQRLQVVKGPLQRHVVGVGGQGVQPGLQGPQVGTHARRGQLHQRPSRQVSTSSSAARRSA